MQLVVEDLGLSWFRLRLPAPPTFFDELESEAILAGQSLRFPPFCQAEMYRTRPPALWVDPFTRDVSE